MTTKMSRQEEHKLLKHQVELCGWVETFLNNLYNHYRKESFTGHGDVVSFSYNSTVRFLEKVFYCTVSVFLYRCIQ